MNRRGCLLIAAVNQYICITFLCPIRKLSCTIPLTLLVRCPTFLLKEWKTKQSALKKIAYVSEVCSAVIVCMALKLRGLEFGVCWRKHWKMTSPGENPWFGMWRMWECGREGQLVLRVWEGCVKTEVTWDVAGRWTTQDIICGTICIFSHSLQLHRETQVQVIHTLQDKPLKY